MGSPDQPLTRQASAQQRRKSLQAQARLQKKQKLSWSRDAAGAASAPASSASTAAPPQATASPGAGIVLLLDSIASPTCVDQAQQSPKRHHRLPRNHLLLGFPVLLRKLRSSSAKLQPSSGKYESSRCVWWRLVTVALLRRCMPSAIKKFNSIFMFQPLPTRHSLRLHGKQSWQHSSSSTRSDSTS